MRCDDDDASAASVDTPVSRTLFGAGNNGMQKETGEKEKSFYNLHHRIGLLGR